MHIFTVIFLSFLAASVLVGLKAEVLEASTLQCDETLELEVDLAFDADAEGWLETQALQLPRRPERHLWRRPVAPPPLQRPKPRHRGAPS